MPWVRFTQKYDWRPHHLQVISFPSGYSGLVSTACADDAISAGVAVRLEEKPEGAARAPLPKIPARKKKKT